MSMEIPKISPVCQFKSEAFWAPAPRKMTSLIVSGLAQTALGRSLFARDIRDMRASAAGL